MEEKIKALKEQMEAALGHVDSKEQLADLLSVDKKVWMEDVENQEQYFAQFGDRLPKEIKEELETLKNNLK